MIWRSAAVFLTIFGICWALISVGQSAASGKPLLQCLLTSKPDCGPAPSPAYRGDAAE